MDRSKMSALYDKISRHARTTQTYVRNSEMYLYHWAHVAPDQGMPAAYWSLVGQLLDTAYAIVERLPSGWFETTTERSFIDGSSFDFNHAEYAVGERLAKLNELYERRARGSRRDVRIRKLENTTGRTAEEAEAYVAKAAELRAAADGIIQG